MMTKWKIINIYEDPNLACEMPSIFNEQEKKNKY